MRTLFTFVILCIIGDEILAGPPIILRDNAGRIVSTITPTTRGTQIVRDAKGRYEGSVVVRSGSVIIRDSSGRIGNLLPSKSGISSKSGRK